VLLIEGLKRIFQLAISNGLRIQLIFYEENKADHAILVPYSGTTKKLSGKILAHLVERHKS
jgi:hypothetical protein